MPHCYVYQAAQNYDEVKTVPRVAEIILEIGEWKERYEQNVVEKEYLQKHDL